MNSYIPILTPINMGTKVEPYSIGEAWVIGSLLILITLTMSSVIGMMARLMWDDDLRVLSILTWCTSLATFVGLTYMIITGIIAPAYGG